MVAQTQTRIRRLNTALANWQRRAKMHEKALQDNEREVLLRRVAELESQIGKPGNKRAVQLEGD
jgi:hypothetical protein